MNLKISIILLISILSINAKAPWREDEMEVRVKFENPLEIQTLEGFKLMGDIYKDKGIANLYIVPGELEEIQNAGLTFEIVEADLRARTEQFWKMNDRRATYMTYDEIISLMNNLSSSYPDICMKKVYGTSVDGRELSALKISDNVSENEPEPEVLFDGGIHGDELGGPENVALFAKFLCEGYGSNSRITELIDSREIWLFCMVNPDGRVYLSRANANRVDLNRNWGFMWNGECTTNRGFSQPETKAMRDCLLENQFSVQITNHSGIEAIFIPWCYTSNVAPEYNLQEALANIYLSTSDYTSFEICQSNHDYPTTGETVDFSYGIMGTAALTMELSQNKQPINSQSIYEKNENAMLEMVDASGRGIGGFITDSETGMPVAARLYFNNSYPSYSDPVQGDYHKYLGSGSYDIKIEANGYKSKTLNSVSISYDSRANVLDVELEPDSSDIIYGYKVVYLKKCSGSSFNILGKNDGIDLALGSNGDIVIDMQYIIQDNDGGEDLTIYSSGSNIYKCEVSAKIDGPWINLGTGSGITKFDINSANIDSARYVKITGSNISIDAVEAKRDKSTDILTINRLNKTAVRIKQSGNMILISNLNGTNREVKLYNALGQNCITKKGITKGTVDLNIKSLSKGIYFLQIRDGISQLCHKISVSD